MKTYYKQVACPKCKGLGYLKVDLSEYQRLVNDRCPKCAGTGKIKQKEETVKL